MAVDDVSFYNLVGEEINRTELVEQMIGYYTLKLEAGETAVTDFNEGSEIRNLLEAFAVDLYMLMEEQNELTSIGFIDSADGEWLDKHGAHPFVNLERDQGSEATGEVTFTIPEALTEDIILEDGIVLVTEDGLEFTTDSECVISAGETTEDVSVTCLTTGTDGNISADTLTIIDDETVEVNGLTVTNSEAFTGGTDYEEDEEYRERLLAYVRQDDFGSISYYNRLAAEVDGVHDIGLFDYAGYTKQVLVNGDTKPCSDEILAEVSELFSDTYNLMLGHTFYITKVQYTSVDMNLTLTVSEELDEDMILSILQIYFDGGSYEPYELDGLYIGDSVTSERIVDILSYPDGLLDATCTLIDPVSSDEVSEVTPASDHVLALGDVTITQNVED